jgi:hypothetical protein
MNLALYSLLKDESSNYQLPGFVNVTIVVLYENSSLFIGSEHLKTYVIWVFL